MQLQTIPRAYVYVSLQLGRLPLSVAEWTTGNERNTQWPPALAYDGFQANVKQTIGVLFNDRELIRQGKLERARVATVREAQDLEVVAAQTKVGAERSYQDRQAADERERRAAHERAARREQDAERERSEAKEKAAATARARKERARREEKKRQDELDATELAARASELAKERKALAARKRAAATKAKLTETDKKLRASKARRAAS